MASIGISIGIDTGLVFTRYRIDTKMCSMAHPYSIQTRKRNSPLMTMFNGGGRPRINSLLNIFFRAPARIDPDKIRVTQGSQQNKPPVTILKSPEVVRGKLFIKGRFIPQCPWKHLFEHITNTRRKKMRKKNKTQFGTLWVNSRGNSSV